MEYSQQNVQKVIEQQPRESRIDRRRTSWRRMIRASSRFPDRSWRAAIIIDNGPADRQAESNGHGADRYSFPLRTDNTRIVIASSFARFSATFFVRVRRLFIGPSPAPILEESNSNPVLPLLSHSLRIQLQPCSSFTFSFSTKDGRRKWLPDRISSASLHPSILDSLHSSVRCKWS